MSQLISLVCLGLSIYGIYLGFRAHVVLGIVLIFVPIVPIVFAIGQLCFGKDLAGQTVEFFRSLN